MQRKFSSNKEFAVIQRLSRLWLLMALVAGVGLAAAGGTVRADTDGPDDPDSRAGAIRGIVVDSEGAPVAEAHWSISDRSGRVIARGMTDRSGHFGHRPLRPGFYAVQAAKREVGSGGARVEIKAGEVSRVRVLLRGR
jgi:hypothetical protein